MNLLQYKSVINKDTIMKILDKVWCWIDGYGVQEKNGYAVIRSKRNVEKKWV